MIHRCKLQYKGKLCNEITIETEHGFSCSHHGVLCGGSVTW